MHRVIIKGVKKWLQQEGGCWDQDLPTVLWSIRTTPNFITGETPFCLTYGFDALLPVDIHLETARVSYYDELVNEQGLQLKCDLLEEKGAVAFDKMARYKGKVATHYNERVRVRHFLVGELVLRARQASAHGKPGKLKSPWEGPYLVRRVVGTVTYELETLERRQVIRSWNGCHLRKYYV
ncbi:hypothetical protein LIER_07865 [Lithospermum erythrorhizon]|uniref:Uncharacterized protein n=1 Tax=Lithospermum erythrorhizon TaxID=34254 RepID=A0AAV3PDQ0_LITER